PMACAAAVATLDTMIAMNLPQRAAALGAAIEPALASLLEAPSVAEVRGRGLLWGVELADRGRSSGAARGFEVVCETLARGVLVLADGEAQRVLELMPPVCLAASQLDSALEALRAALAATEREP